MQSRKMPALLCILLLAAIRIQAQPPEETPLRDSIQFVKFDRNTEQVKVNYQPLKEKPTAPDDETQTRGMLVNPGMRTVLISPEKVMDAWKIPLREIGVVKLGDDKHDAIFLGMHSGGSGYAQKTLALLNPHNGKVIWLRMDFVLTWTDLVTDLEKSDNFDDPDMKAEAGFLDKLKIEYGYVSKEMADQSADKPWFAFYFWKKDNGEVKNGPIKIRKYKKPLPELGSEEDKIEMNGVIYRAHFKAGVIAEDKKTGEEWVVYHPRSKYSWPQVLAQYKDWLIIGTRGEGVVYIHTKDNWMKRVPIEGKHADAGELKIEKDRIVVNGEISIALPGKKK
ncbi:MAG: hypothetical protein ACLFUS_16475 [Candidatus Sumerlaeia bacterium]